MLECLKPTVKRCKQREIVAVSGAPFHGVGVVLTGRVAVTRETYSGNRIILEFVDAGETFGGMVAFSDTRVWPVTVVTQEDSCLLFLPPDRITGNCANVCAAHGVLVRNMLNMLSNRALVLNRKIEFLSARSIRAKLSSYFLDMCRQANGSAFEIPMKRHELADYLGIPRPSLSREMCAMRDAGIIEFKGPSVRVKKMLMLEESLD